jgi:hypothetical protein
MRQPQIEAMPCLLVALEAEAQMIRHDAGTFEKGVMPMRTPICGGDACCCASAALGKPNGPRYATSVASAKASRPRIIGLPHPCATGSTAR